MPVLFVFLLKVNIALIIFCLGYYLVLRKLTFYTLNRVYLGLGILLSSVYPLINIDDFVYRHQQLAAPVQRVVLNWKAPAEQFIQQPGYWYWATVIFWLGAVVFASRLLVQLFSLYKLYRNSKPANIQEHRVRVTDANISPFSFWQNIYINPDNIDDTDLPSILRHEQIHVKEWHTLDILLAEISVIFYWFNPGVWLMKKAVRENIEFITDRKILQLGADSKAYQYSLLNVSIAATTSAGITNHFNFSTLKKRIKMMNAKRSSKVNLTRYAFLVPAVLLCLFVFSISKAELVKKSKVAYKSIANSVNNLVKSDPTTISEKTASTNGEIITVDKVLADTTKKSKKGSQIYVVMSDDTTKSGAHPFTMVRVANGDSTNYTINGKKVTEAEFKKLQPSDLQTINIIGGGDKDNDEKNIKSVVITTKNGATANTVNAWSPVTMVRINGVKDTTKKSISFTYHNNNDTAKNKVIKSVINYSYTFKSDANNNKSDDQKITTVTLTPPPNYTEFKGKLILIDGKEATPQALKKLSASDIDSITPFKGDDENPDGGNYIQKYGDKAKNGVVWISTKKAKK
ncbi:MAG: M56 family metallopeptidase [Bacteroidota bacterium]